MLKNGILAGDVEIMPMLYWWLQTKLLLLLKDSDAKEMSLVKRRVKEIIQSKPMCFKKLKYLLEEDVKFRVAGYSYVKTVRQMRQFEEQLVKGFQLS